MTLTRDVQSKQMTAHLVADVTLYPTAADGRQSPVQPSWGCPCFVSRQSTSGGYDARLLLDAPLAPGDSDRLGFVFLSGDEAAAAFRKAGVFYLWDGKFVGEAKVI